MPPASAREIISLFQLPPASAREIISLFQLPPASAGGIDRNSSIGFSPKTVLAKARTNIKILDL